MNYTICDNMQDRLCHLHSAFILETKFVEDCVEKAAVEIREVEDSIEKPKEVQEVEVAVDFIETTVVEVTEDGDDNIVEKVEEPVEMCEDVQGVEGADNLEVIEHDVEEEVENDVESDVEMDAVEELVETDTSRNPVECECLYPGKENDICEQVRSLVEGGVVDRPVEMQDVEVHDVENDVEMDDIEETNAKHVEKTPVENHEDQVEEPYIYCRKSDSRCETHIVDLVSRRHRTRVWKQNTRGIYRHVYQMVRTLVCPVFSGISSYKITEPLQGTSAQQSTKGGNYQRGNPGIMKRKYRK